MKQLILKDNMTIVLIPETFEIQLSPFEHGVSLLFMHENIVFYETMIYVEPEKCDKVVELICESFFTNFDDDLQEYVSDDICTYLQKGIYYDEEEDGYSYHPNFDLEYYAERWEDYVKFLIKRGYGHHSNDEHKSGDSSDEE